MKAQVILEGNNIRLRPMEAADVDAIWNIINQPSVRKWWGNETLQDVIEYLSDPEIEVWSIEMDAQVVGVVQCYEELTPDYKYAGMDIGLSSDYQGKGNGPRALSLVARYLFEQKGHHRLVIDPDADNERAIAAYKKLGYKPVGIMRQYARDIGKKGWHDGLLMDLLKTEFVEVK